MHSPIALRGIVGQRKASGFCCSACAEAGASGSPGCCGRETPAVTRDAGAGAAGCACGVEHRPAGALPERAAWDRLDEVARQFELARELRALGWPTPEDTAAEWRRTSPTRAYAEQLVADAARRRSSPGPGGGGGGGGGGGEDGARLAMSREVWEGMDAAERREYLRAVAHAGQLSEQQTQAFVAGLINRGFDTLVSELRNARDIRIEEIRSRTRIEIARITGRDAGEREESRRDEPRREAPPPPARSEGSFATIAATVGIGAILARIVGAGRLGPRPARARRGAPRLVEVPSAGLAAAPERAAAATVAVLSQRPELPALSDFRASAEGPAYWVAGDALFIGGGTRILSDAINDLLPYERAGDLAWTPALIAAAEQKIRDLGVSVAQWPTTPGPRPDGTIPLESVKAVLWTVYTPTLSGGPSLVRLPVQVGAPRTGIDYTRGAQTQPVGTLRPFNPEALRVNPWTGRTGTAVGGEVSINVEGRPPARSSALDDVPWWMWVGGAALLGRAL